MLQHSVLRTISPKISCFFIVCDGSSIFSKVTAVLLGERTKIVHESDALNIQNARAQL